jgi:hypothetical protein
LPRFEVQPQELFTASGRQNALAGEVAGLCGRVESAGQSAADAAGEPAAAAAIADYAMAWSLSMKMLSGSLGALANNVGTAGSAYQATDNGVMPR